MTEDDCAEAVIERLRAEADAFRERAQIFDKQIAERTRWIAEALRREADLRTAIRALESSLAVADTSKENMRGPGDGPLP